MSNSSTFKAIKEIVQKNNLNNKGFSRIEIVKKFEGVEVKARTIQVFIGKHADGGGNTPTLYFDKIAEGKYRIKSEYLK